MPTSTFTRPGSRRSARALVGAAVIALGLTACVPDPGSTAPPTVGAGIQITSATVTEGDTVTITGTGFDPNGNIGTRPPLQGSPAGVYVVFGRFAPVWKPSANAGGRTVIVQKWAVPEASRQTLIGFPWFQDPASFVTIAADGSWTAEITVPDVDNTFDDYGFAVYPGSGASNTGEEFLERVTVAEPV